VNEALTDARRQRLLTDTQAQFRGSTARIARLWRESGRGGMAGGRCLRNIVDLASLAVQRSLLFVVYSTGWPKRAGTAGDRRRGARQHIYGTVVSRCRRDRSSFTEGQFDVDFDVTETPRLASHKTRKRSCTRGCATPVRSTRKTRRNEAPRVHEPSKEVERLRTKQVT
jgi:hypothetical protein